MDNYHTSEKLKTALWWTWQDLNLKQDFSVYVTSIKKHHSKLYRGCKLNYWQSAGSNIMGKFLLF